MKIRSVLLSIFLILLLTLPAATILAQGGGESGVYFEPYVLNEGQVIEGDLVIIALDGPITLQHGSRVTGNATLISIGHEVIINGTVEGNLDVMAWEIDLGTGLNIGGDVYLCGAAEIRLDDVSLDGDYNIDCENVDRALRTAAPIAFDPGRWHGEFRPELVTELFSQSAATPIEQLGWNFNYALTMGAFASLMTLLFPHRLRRISRAAYNAPAATWGLGILSMLMIAGISALTVIIVVLLFWLILPMLLLPLLLIVWLAVFLLWVIGWSSLSLPLGLWLLALLNIRPVSPMAAAAVGGIVLTFAVSLLGLFAPITLVWLLALISMIGWGFGAVLLTRVGKYPYPNPYGTK